MFPDVLVCPSVAGGVVAVLTSSGTVLIWGLKTQNYIAKLQGRKISAGQYRNNVNRLISAPTSSMEREDYLHYSPFECGEEITCMALYTAQANALDPNYAYFSGSANGSNERRDGMDILLTGYSNGTISAWHLAALCTGNVPPTSEIAQQQGSKILPREFSRDCFLVCTATRRDKSDFGSISCLAVDCSNTWIAASVRDSATTMSKGQEKGRSKSGTYLSSSGRTTRVIKWHLPSQLKGDELSIYRLLLLENGTSGRV